MSVFRHTPACRPVDGWAPLKTVEENLDVTHDILDHVAAAGYHPVAASVAGSRLRGLDHEDSDTDVLVVVNDDKATMDRLNRCGSVHKSFALDNETEGQLVSLTSFMEKVSTSVPYASLLYSPLLVTDTRYTPLFAATRPSTLSLLTHADRFMVHAVSRAAQGHRKAANNALAAYTLARRLNATLSRQEATPGSPLCLTVADHVEEVFTDYLDNPDHVRVHKDQNVSQQNFVTVVEYLRG